jgi:hypothetical protein
MVCVVMAARRAGGAWAWRMLEGVGVAWAVTAADGDGGGGEEVQER